MFFYIRRRSVIVLLFIVFSAISLGLFSQEPVIGIHVHSFFDNPEFGVNGLRPSRTEAGVRLGGQVGFRWDTTSALCAGFSGVHEYGSKTSFVATEPMVYYSSHRKHLRYFIGAFPRRETIGNYPRIFFRDSIANYRTVLNGIFYELRSEALFANAWLDWTGRQSIEERESFFVGWAAGWNYCRFHARLFGYLFHFAPSANPDVHDPLHDNALQLFSGGIDLSGLLPIDVLDITLGHCIGLERNRDIKRWHTPQGVLSELRLGHYGFRIVNSLYCGDPQQVFPENGSKLYWGDPVYRQRLYNRTDFSYTCTPLRHVKVEITCSLHVGEQTVDYEQMLHLYVDLDNCLDFIRKH
ncbi:MAG: hypothetical protein LBU03_04965 [Tannerellaceae bacterium]|jgi:hypothetical protein|nr:hypothetical protein [Tannerellaceae bacterium]